MVDLFVEWLSRRKKWNNFIIKRKNGKKKEVHQKGFGNHNEYLNICFAFESRKTFFAITCPYIYIYGIQNEEHIGKQMKR